MNDIHDWTDKRLDDLNDLVKANDRRLDNVEKLADSHEASFRQLGTRRGDFRRDFIVIACVILTFVFNVLIQILVIHPHK